MELPQLVVELVGDYSKLLEDIKRARVEAVKQAQFLEKDLNLTIGVNDDSLKNLNKHFDLKVTHFKQTQTYFKNNPLKVFVDDNSLTKLNKDLDKLGRKKTNINVSNSGGESSGDVRVSIDNNTDNKEIINSLKSIENAIKAQSKQSLLGSAASGIFTGFTEEIGRNISRKTTHKGVGKIVSKIQAGFKVIDEEIIGKSQVYETFLAELLRNGQVGKAFDVASKRTTIYKQQQRLGKLQVLSDETKTPKEREGAFDQILKEEPALQEQYNSYKAKFSKKSETEVKSSFIPTVLDKAQPTSISQKVVMPLINEFQPLLRFIQGMQSYNTSVLSQQFYNERKPAFPILGKGENVVSVFGGAENKKGQGGRAIATSLEPLMPGLRFMPVENLDTDATERTADVDNFIKSLLTKFAPDLLSSSSTITNSARQVAFSLNPLASSVGAAQALANTKLAKEQGAEASALSFSLGGADAYRYAKTAEYEGIDTKTMAMAYPFVNFAGAPPKNFKSAILNPDPLSFPFKLGLNNPTPEANILKDTTLPPSASVHGVHHLFKSPQFRTVLGETTGVMPVGRSGKEMSRTQQQGSGLQQILIDLERSKKSLSQGSVDIDSVETLSAAKSKLEKYSSEGTKVAKVVAEKLEKEIDEIIERIKEFFKSKNIELPDDLTDLKNFSRYISEVNKINNNLLSFKSGKKLDNDTGYFSGGLDVATVAERKRELQLETLPWFKSQNFGEYSPIINSGFEDLLSIQDEFVRTNGKLSAQTIQGINPIPLPEGSEKLLEMQREVRRNFPSEKFYEENIRLASIPAPDSLKKYPATILAFNKMVTSLGTMMPDASEIKTVGFGFGSQAATTLMTDELAYKTTLDPDSAKKIASEQEIKAYEKLQGRHSPLLYAAKPGEALVTEKIKGTLLRDILEGMAEPIKVMQEELAKETSTDKQKEIGARVRDAKEKFNTIAEQLYYNVGQLGGAMHQMGVAHNDLTSGNVFFDKFAVNPSNNKVQFGEGGGVKAIDLERATVNPNGIEQAQDQLTTIEKVFSDPSFRGILDPIRTTKAITSGYANPLPIPEVRQINPKLLTPQKSATQIPIGYSGRSMLQEITGNLHSFKPVPTYAIGKPYTPTPVSTIPNGYQVIRANPVIQPTPSKDIEMSEKANLAVKSAQELAAKFNANFTRLKSLLKDAEKTGNFAPVIELSAAIKQYGDKARADIEKLRNGAELSSNFATGKSSAQLAQAAGQIASVQNKAARINTLHGGESIGENIGKGVAKGLESSLNDLRNAAEKLADIVPDVVTEKLKMQSPSKVMMEHGKNVGGGLSVGIDNSLKNVKSSSEKLANTVINAVEEKLEIKSPSRWGIRTGKYVGEGFVKGLEFLEGSGVLGIFIKVINDIKNTVENGDITSSTENFKNKLSRGFSKGLGSIPGFKEAKERFKGYRDFLKEVANPNISLALGEELANGIVAAKELFVDFLKMPEKLVEGFNQAKVAFDSFVEGMSKVQKFGEMMDFLKSSIGNVVKVLGLLVVGKIILDLAPASIEVAANFENLERRIKFTSGSISEGAKNIAFLRSEAKRLNVDLSQTLESGSKFFQATKDTPIEGYQSRQIVSAVTQASAVYGLDLDKQQRTFTALEQMSGKTVVSQEELRQQLAEAIPNASQIAANAYGTTTQSMNQLLSTGRVLAEDFLPKFAQQLKAETSSGVGDAVNSSVAITNKFNNSLIELQESIGKTLLPFRNFSLSVFASGIDLVTKNFQLLQSVLLITLIKLGSPIWMMFAAYLKEISFSGNLAKSALLGMGQSIATLAKQMFVLSMATKAIDEIMMNFKDNSGAIGEQTRNVTQSINEQRKLLSPSSKTSSDDFSVFRERFTLNPFDNDTKKLKKQMEDSAKQTNLGQQNTFDVLKDSKSPAIQDAIQEIQAIDKALDNIKMKRRAVIANNPGDIQTLRELQNQEKELSQRREKPLELFGGNKANLDKQVETLKTYLEYWEELKKNPKLYQNEIDDINKIIKVTKEDLATVTAEQDKMTKAIKNSLTEMQKFAIEVRNTEAKFNDLRSARDKTLNLEKTNLFNLGSNGSIQPGQIEYTNNLTTQADLINKIADNLKQVQEMSAQLEINGLRDVLSTQGLTKNTGIDTLKSAEERAIDGSKEKEILAGFIKVKEMQVQTVDMQTQLSEQKYNLTQSLYQQTKQVADYYRAAVRESKAVGIEFKKAQKTLENSKVQNKLREALIGAGDNIYTQFVEGIINLISQTSDIQKQQLESKKQRIDYDNNVQDIKLQAAELQRSLPGKIIPLDSGVADNFDLSLKNVNNTVNEINKNIKDVADSLSKDVVDAAKKADAELDKLNQSIKDLDSSSNSWIEGFGSKFARLVNVFENGFDGIGSKITDLQLQTASWLGSLGNAPTMLGSAINVVEGAKSAVTGIFGKEAGQQLEQNVKSAGAISNLLGANKNGILSPIQGTTVEDLLRYKPSYQQGFYGIRDEGARQHSKVDFNSRAKAGQNAKIIASLPGTATARKWTGNSGVVFVNSVLSSGQKLTLEYGHLSLESIKKAFGGQLGKSIEVQAGQKLGNVIHDALSSGPHLDFGVRLNGKYIDPQKFLQDFVAGKYGGVVANGAKQSPATSSEIQELQNAVNNFSQTKQKQREYKDERNPWQRFTNWLMPKAGASEIPTQKSPITVSEFSSSGNNTEAVKGSPIKYKFKNQGGRVVSLMQSIWKGQGDLEKWTDGANEYYFVLNQELKRKQSQFFKDKKPVEVNSRDFREIKDIKIARSVAIPNNQNLFLIPSLTENVKETSMLLAKQGLKIDAVLGTGYINSKTMRREDQSFGFMRTTGGVADIGINPHKPSGFITTTSGETKLLDLSGKKPSEVVAEINKLKKNQNVLSAVLMGGVVDVKAKQPNDNYKYKTTFVAFDKSDNLLGVLGTSQSNAKGRVEDARKAFGGKVAKVLQLDGDFFSKFWFADSSFAKASDQSALTYRNALLLTSKIKANQNSNSGVPDLSKAFILQAIREKYQESLDDASPEELKQKIGSGKFGIPTNTISRLLNTNIFGNSVAKNRAKKEVSEFYKDYIKKYNIDVDETVKGIEQSTKGYTAKGALNRIGRGIKAVLPSGAEYAQVSNQNLGRVNFQAPKLPPATKPLIKPNQYTFQKNPNPRPIPVTPTTSKPVVRTNTPQIDPRKLGLPSIQGDSFSENAQNLINTQLKPKPNQATLQKNPNLRPIPVTSKPVAVKPTPTLAKPNQATLQKNPNLRSSKPVAVKPQPTGNWMKTIASTYGEGKGEHGGKTASGEIFNKNAMTAAMNQDLKKKLGVKWGDKVEAVNEKNSKSVIVRITDHGPYEKKNGKFVPHSSRGLDLSTAAANKIGVSLGEVKFRLLGKNSQALDSAVLQGKPVDPNSQQKLVTQATKLKLNTAAQQYEINRTNSNLSPEQIKENELKQRLEAYRFIMSSQKTALGDISSTKDSTLGTRRTVLDGLSPNMSNAGRFSLQFNDLRRKLEKDVESLEQIIRETDGAIAQKPDLQAAFNLAMKKFPNDPKLAAEALQTNDLSFKATAFKNAEAKNNLAFLKSNINSILKASLEDFDKKEFFRLREQDIQQQTKVIERLQQQLQLVQKLKEIDPLNPLVLNIPSLQRNISLLELNRDQYQQLLDLQKRYYEGGGKGGNMSEEAFQKEFKAILGVNSVKKEGVALNFNYADTVERIRYATDELTKAQTIQASSIKLLQLDNERFAIDNKDGMVSLVSLTNELTIKTNELTNAYKKQLLEIQGNTLLSPQEKLTERLKAFRNYGKEKSNLDAENSYQTKLAPITNRGIELGRMEKLISSENAVSSEVMRGQGLFGIRNKELQKAQVLSQIKMDFEREKMEIEKFSLSTNLAAEYTQKLTNNLNKLNELKLDNVAKEFNMFTEAISGIKGDFDNILKGFIMNDSVSKNAGDLQGINKSLDDIAKKRRDIIMNTSGNIQEVKNAYQNPGNNEQLKELDRAQRDLEKKKTELGKRSIGDAFSEIGKSILSNLASVASKELSNQLFGKLTEFIFGKKKETGAAALNSAGSNLSSAALMLKEAALALRGGGGAGGGLGEGLFGILEGSSATPFTSSGEFDFSSGFDLGGGLDFGSAELPSFAKGGMVGDLLNKERSLSGFNPRLIIANEGERVLTPKETKLWNQLNSSNKLESFSSGGMVGQGLGNINNVGRSGDTINITPNVNINNEGGGNINKALFEKALEAKIQETIKQERRPGGSLNRGGLYDR